MFTLKTAWLSIWATLMVFGLWLLFMGLILAGIYKVHCTPRPVSSPASPGKLELMVYHDFHRVLLLTQPENERYGFRHRADIYTYSD